MNQKRKKKNDLDLRLKACKKCPGLNIPSITENAVGYGNLNSPIMMIGQSLCTKCMATQIPFTGGSGLILDAVFKKIGIKKKDLFTTNLVHCHPVDNRPSSEIEINCCLPYLWEEIELVNPLLIIGFGNDTRTKIIESLPFNYVVHFEYGAQKLVGRHLVFVYHPAYHWRRSGLHGKETLEYIDYLAGIMKEFV